jgi:hypothetical protein
MPPPPTLTKEEEKERQRRIGLVDKIGSQPAEPAAEGTVQYPAAPTEQEIGPQLEDAERQRRINLVGQGGKAPVKRERKTVKELEAERDEEKKAKEQREEDKVTAAAKAGGYMPSKYTGPFMSKDPKKDSWVNREMPPSGSVESGMRPSLRLGGRGTMKVGAGGDRYVVPSAATETQEEWEKRRLALEAERDEKEAYTIDDSSALTTAASGAAEGVRAVRDIAQFRFVGKLFGDSTERIAKEIGVGAGGIAGMKWGFDAQKFIPHPIGKAAAPALGALAGQMLGRAAIDERAMTAGEIAEAATYSAGYSSILQQFKNLGRLKGGLMGAAEGSLIVEMGTQQRSLIDEGKLTPVGTTEFYVRHALGAGLGGIMGTVAGGKAKMPVREEMNRFNKLQKEHNRLLEKRSGLEISLQNKYNRLLEKRRILQNQATALDGTSESRAGARKVLNEEILPEIKRVEAEIAEQPKLLDKDLLPQIKKIEDEMLALPKSKGFREAVANDWIEVLDNHWSRWDKIAKNKTNTRGERNHAAEVAAQLREDIITFRHHWPEFIETASNNPEFFTRLSQQMKQARAIKDDPTFALKSGVETVEEAVKNTTDWFRALNRGDQKALLAASEQLSPKRVFSAGDTAHIERMNPLKAISNPRRYYLGQVKVLREAAMDSELGRAGRAQDNELWKLADKMESALNDGKYLSAMLTTQMTREARRLGWGSLVKKGREKLNAPLTDSTEAIAMREYEEFQRIRHTGEMPDGTTIGKRGERVLTHKEALKEIQKAKKARDLWALTKEEVADSGIIGSGEGATAHADAVNAALAAGKPVPIRVIEQFPELAAKFRKERGWDSQLNQKSIVEDPKIGNANVSEELWAMEARKYYDRVSPMGRAMIDGARESYEDLAKMMSEMGVVIEGQGKNKNRIFNWNGESYFGRRLKPELLDALLNIDNPSGKNIGGRAKATKELFKINGLDESPDSIRKLKERYKTFFDEAADGETAAKTGGGESSWLKARLDDAEVPAQMYDYTWQGSLDHVRQAGARLAEIKYLGQKNHVSGGLNPYYAFKLAREAVKGDQDTLRYIDGVELSMTGKRDPQWAMAHAAVTGALIANGMSAFKNLSGVMKIWSISDTGTLAKSFGKAIKERTKQTFKNVDANVAEELGIVGDNVSLMTQLLEANRGGGKLNQAVQKATTFLMKTQGFTPVENLVRQTAYYQAEYSLQGFLKLYKDNPNAKAIVAAQMALKRQPSSLAGHPVKLHHVDGAAEALKKFDSKADVALKEYARLYDGLGLDMRKLISEGTPPTDIGPFGAKVRLQQQIADGNTAGVMPETRRLYQRMVEKSQGAYDQASLPQHMHKGEGWRFYQKFSSWQKQMMNLFEDNVLKEAEHGNYKPIAKWAAAAQISGEIISKVGEETGLLTRRDSSLKEIQSYFEDGDIKTAGKMILTRFIYNNFYSGMAAIPTEIASRYLVAEDQGWDSTAMSAGAGIDNLALAVKALTAYKTHGSERKLQKDLGMLASAPRRLGQLGTKFGVFGEDEKKLADRITVKRKLSGYAKRFKEDPSSPYWEKGIKSTPATSTAVEFKAGERYDFTHKLGDLLLLGNPEAAKELVDTEVAKIIEEDEAWSPSDAKDLYQSIAQSIGTRRPLRVGGKISSQHVLKFQNWILKRQGAQVANKVNAVDEIYMETARAAGLIKPEKELTLEEESRRLSKLANTAVSKTTEKWFERWHEEVGEGLSEEEQADALTRAWDLKWGPDVGDGRYVRTTEKLRKKETDANQRLQYAKALLMKKHGAGKLGSVALTEEFNGITNSKVKADYLIKHWNELGVRGGIQDGYVRKMVEYKLLTQDDLWSYMDSDARKERDKKK